METEQTKPCIRQTFTARSKFDAGRGDEQRPLHVYLLPKLEQK